VHAEKVFKDKKQLYTASLAEPFINCRLGKSASPTHVILPVTY